MGRHKKHCARIQQAVISLRSRMRKTPEADPLIWPIRGELACSQRPLRDHRVFEDCNPLPSESFPLIANWIDKVCKAGIRGVICLLTPKQLQRYEGFHTGGLLGAYREAGLTVVHIPVFDEVHPDDTEGSMVLGKEVFNKAFECFSTLPKPVLLHCSAGIDRSSPVAAEIVVRSGKQLFR